ncbi:MAG: HD domain-containing protein [Nitrospirae bacterium]|nr:HD domain-containing protein [Nitrospirota bacterium]
MGENAAHSGIQKDLELTVRELSDTYEELSLLYKLSEVLSGMSVDEIAEKVVEEAVDTLDVKTAAILFLDEENERLVTKSFRGRWNKDTTIHKDDRIIWNAVSERKPVAFCKLSDAGHADYTHAEGSILVCPLVGKIRVIGAMVLADRESNAEFYSNDIKLMMAIASQAAITVENALLYKELEDFLLAAIKSLVKALEASSRWTAGHTERVTEYAIGIGSAMGLGVKHLERLRICSLLHDIGKIAVPREILDKAGRLTEDEEKVVRRHPLIGVEILGGFRQLQDVILGIKYHHEWWDGGHSLLGLKGEDIPLMARILTVADCFDAMSSDRPYRRRKARDETLKEIISLSGKQFDPEVVEAFKQWLTQQHPVSAP